MGFSSSGAAVIIFTVTIILAVTMYGVYSTSEEAIRRANEDRDQRQEELDRTSISLMSVKYDPVSNVTTLVLTNDGQAVLDSSELDILSGGHYRTSLILSIDAPGTSGSTWLPGESVTIYLEGDVFEFDVGVSPRLDDSITAGLASAGKLAVDNGTIYVIDGGTSVKVYSTDGVFLDSFTGGLTTATDITLGDDHIFIIDGTEVKVYDKATYAFDDMMSATINSNMTAPSSLSFAGGKLYVLDDDGGWETDIHWINETLPLDDTGLVGYWKLDEGAGVTAVDSSGNGNHGTLEFATYGAGRYGTSVQGDGWDDCVDLGDVMPAGAYTKMGWMKREAGNSNNVFLGGDTNPGETHIMWAPFWGGYNFKLAAGHNGVNNIVISPAILDESTWYFVALTFDPAVAAGELVLYINGTQVDRAIGVPTQADSTVTWMGRANGVGRTFSGNIDDVRLYSRALTYTEISDYWNETFTRGGRDTLNSTAMSGNADLGTPEDLYAMEHNGTTHVFFLDDNGGGTEHVDRVDQDGNTVTAEIIAVGDLDDPRDLALSDPDFGTEMLIYVVNNGAEVTVYNSTGALLETITEAIGNDAQGVAVGASFYVADPTNGILKFLNGWEIRVVTENGKSTTLSI